MSGVVPACSTSPRSSDGAVCRRAGEPLGYVPPAEFEKGYHDRQAAPVGMAVLTFSRNRVSGEPGAVQFLTVR